jgi:YegS/Rv2252/BmrU family lipid kinase
LGAILKRHGIAADIAEPTDEAEARAAVRRAVADGIDIVVAAGGDGTVHLVAEELLGTDTALGVLPLGRVMNIARSLGIERDLDVAADVLVSGEIRTIDTAEAVAADGRVVPFLEAGSVGLNAAIFREVARVDDGDPGSVLGTIRSAISYRPTRMTIELDGGRIRTRALMVAASIGPYLGLGMTVAPDARLDDGRFDVRVFRGFSKLQLLRHLASIAFGRTRRTPKVSTYRSASVRIIGMQPLPARADGVDLGHTPVAYRIRPRSLLVVVPRVGQPAGGGSSGSASGRRRM